VIAVANVVVLVVVWDHVGGFWKGKAMVPLPKISEYNEAISKTQEARLNMAYLAASWVVAGGLALISCDTVTEPSYSCSEARLRGPIKLCVVLEAEFDGACCN
jgi:hypothetical protein